jgi:predicted phage-related endonuclease
MKILTYSDKDKWLDARLGKVTGTRLKDLIVKRGTGRKKGFYEIIAERIALPRDDNENRLERGITLEGEAVDRFTKQTRKKVDTSLVIWEREDNSDIAISPDGFIKTRGKIAEAVEVKCLNQASHLEAYMTKQIPSEYEYQVRQYFIVNDELKTLYFCFYDPSMPPPVDFFFLKVERKDIQEEVTELLEIERATLAEIEQIINELI